MRSCHSPVHLFLAAAALAVALPAALVAQAPRRFVSAAEGNEARYRVREQLTGFDLPNDAIGSTRHVTGVIVLDARGIIVADSSRFVIDLRELRSDRDRRDNYLRRRTLQTDSFPTAMLVPRSIHGLPSPLPTSGRATFQVIGDLTIRGVTRPTTWDIEATFTPGSIQGTARIAFNFNAFSLEVPRVRSVLSIEDNIKLEYDFRLVADTAGGSP